MRDRFGEMKPLLRTRANRRELLYRQRPREGNGRCDFGFVW